MDFLVRVEAGQQGVHSCLCLGVVPVHGSTLGEVSLAGNNGQRAVVDQGLQNAHGALEEVGSIGVSGAAAEQLDVPGTLALHFLQAIQQSLSLQLTGLDAAELHHAVNAGGILQETVITNDINAGSLGLFQDSAQLGAVDGANNDNLGAVLNHRFDLLLLRRNLIVSSLDDGLEAGSFQLRLEHFFGFFPVLGTQPRQGDADGGAGLKAAGCSGSLSTAVGLSGLCSGGSGCGSRFGTATAAGSHGQDHNQNQEQREQFFHCFFLLLLCIWFLLRPGCQKSIRIICQQGNLLYFRPYSC